MGVWGGASNSCLSKSNGNSLFSGSAAFLLALSFSSFLSFFQDFSFSLVLLEVTMSFVTHLLVVINSLLTLAYFIQLHLNSYLASSFLIVFCCEAFSISGAYTILFSSFYRISFLWCCIQPLQMNKGVLILQTSMHFDQISNKQLHIK